MRPRRAHAAVAAREKGRPGPGLAGLFPGGAARARRRRPRRARPPSAMLPMTHGLPTYRSEYGRMLKRPGPSRRLWATALSGIFGALLVLYLAFSVGRSAVETAVDVAGDAVDAVEATIHAEIPALHRLSHKMREARRQHRRVAGDMRLEARASIAKELRRQARGARGAGGAEEDAGGAKRSAKDAKRSAKDAKRNAKRDANGGKDGRDGGGAGGGAARRRERARRAARGGGGVLPEPDGASGYSFDVSFPIKSDEMFRGGGDRCRGLVDCSREGMRALCPGRCGSQAQVRYAAYMEGCAGLYSAAACGATERQRMTNNREQPSGQTRYTEVGFRKQAVPGGLWGRVRSYWEASRKEFKREAWPKGNTYTNHWESPTYMLSLEDADSDPRGPHRDSGRALRGAIFEALEPILEEWTGQKLKRTSLYGIRVYQEGAILAPHVDRHPLVSSAIINVAQEAREPWPLEIYDHEGRAHNVTIAPGEMILYESHVCTHGRPFPLRGDFMANIFVHFMPVHHGEA